MTKNELDDILNSNAFENKVTILARRVFIKSALTAKNIANPFIWVIVVLAGYIFTNFNQTVLTLNENVVQMRTAIELLQTSLANNIKEINEIKLISTKAFNQAELNKQAITQLIDKKLLQ